MRLLFLLLFLGHNALAPAQIGQWPAPQADASVEQLPTWMYELVKGERPRSKWKPEGQPLHTNAFKGEWTVQFKNQRRVECWSDARRLVFREFKDTTLQRATLVDLHANVRINVSWYKGQAAVKIEDLHIPQAGYFRELWNDSVAPTGRTKEILGSTCSELRGIDGNKDTTSYWHSDIHPALFADLQAWAQWLCREGDLEHLSALSDKNAGASLRVDWNKRKYGPEAGSLWFTSIRLGRTAMPRMDLRGARVQENRMRWQNSSQLGRLPSWMRERINKLPPDPMPTAYTPPAVDRGIADNAFIGTFTAETPTHYIDEKRDTTIRLAKYSYWADARRAVLSLDDPDDEGTVIYMVDLDADVVIYANNEGHSYVIPKLHIGTLERAGLVEFGRGVDIPFTATEHTRTLLGHKCTLHTTSERYLTYYWFPDVPTPNPIFDMARWMEPRPSQKFKDIMFFGATDKPIPFAVMGTALTSFKPGRTGPPTMDLSNYLIRDERLRDRRERERERAEPMIREITIGDMELMMDDVAVPDMEMEEVEEVVPMREPRAVPPPPAPPKRIDPPAPN